jgi:hypothetical protein
MIPCKDKYFNCDFKPVICVDWNQMNMILYTPLKQIMSVSFTSFHSKPNMGTKLPPKKILVCHVTLTKYMTLLMLISSNIVFKYSYLSARFIGIQFLPSFSVLAIQCVAFRICYAKRKLNVNNSCLFINHSSLYTENILQVTSQFICHIWKNNHQFHLKGIVCLSSHRGHSYVFFSFIATAGKLDRLGGETSCKKKLYSIMKLVS